MIPNLFPQKNPSPGEKQLFAQLRNDPIAHDWIILHSLDLMRHPTQDMGECDFVLLIPNEGIVCIEIKSAKQIRREKGLWYYSNDPRPNRSPFKQVRTAHHALRNYLSVKGIPFAPLVIFTHSPFTQTSPEWEPHEFIDSVEYHQYPSIAQLILNKIHRRKERLSSKYPNLFITLDSPHPSSETCSVLAETLRRDFVELDSAKARRMRIEHESHSLLEEQRNALKLTTLNPRVYVNGPAGSGKTFLALERAVINAERKIKTAFLCFNRHLATWLKKEFNKRTHLTSEQKSAVTICSASALMQTLSNLHWTPQTPELAIQHLRQKILRQQTQFKFDELILDESQDILHNPDYTEFLNLILKGGLKQGTWKFFGDFENQSIYGQTQNWIQEARNSGIQLSEIQLYTNCRNPLEIARTAEKLSQFPVECIVRRSDPGFTPEILSYSSTETEFALLIESLKRLHQEGYEASEIIILSCKTENQSVANALATLTQVEDIGVSLRPYNRHRPIDYSYSTIRRFKGLEAPVVILTDLDSIGKETNDLLYIGATRATERLIILHHTSLTQELQNRMDGKTQRIIKIAA